MYKAILEGVHQRYMRDHTAEDVMRHLQMAAELILEAVQLELKRGRHWYELTLVTGDRPFLFAKLAGLLAAGGMTIVKANALWNQASTVVDALSIPDRVRTLEVDVAEVHRYRWGVCS